MPVADSGAFLQIAEPERPRQSRREPGFAIGIDLGTTHSLVALAARGAEARVLTDDEGRALVPSVVSYARPEPTVGHPALADRPKFPTRVLSSVKRFIGRGPDEIDFRHPYQLVRHPGDNVVRFDVGEGRVCSPIEASAEILKRLRARAETELGRPVSGAVITVPAYFDDAQRQATKDAGRIAGLEVYRLLAEPTAAALAYGLDSGRSGYFAVYDLGGGTFDVSVLRLRDGVFQVLATGGDSQLGGDDFDRRLAADLLRAAGVDEPTPAQWQEVVAEARRVKESLSECDTVTVELHRSPLREHRVTRAAFEATIESLVRDTIRTCRGVLKDADLSTDDLDGVVLVGGSTRVPLVRRLVEQAFRRAPLTDIDPDRVVAYGAAISADVLSGSERDGVTLLDVVPLSLGLETMGGIVEKIIPRNATIPIAARQVFTNYSEKQTGMSMHVVQGERELAADCRSLARFELSGLPPLPPSMARVEVTFQLDADALLTVTARELMTQKQQSVEVKPTYGLSEAEVNDLVRDSLDHAREDFAARDLAEARVELGRVVLAVRTALSEVGHIEGLLSEAERVQLERQLGEAERLMSDGQVEATAINAAREQLEQTSGPFARRRMERALNANMSGKSLSEIEQVLAADDETLDERRGGHQAEQIETT
ncbi:MAG: Fe-S protein assembly chaperone HscA [Myxococcales bacterium FL481]|nr:MAG: Fe-S protein assembly chaperone HscA [Myxococcales bacterium FL481]